MPTGAHSSTLSAVNRAAFVAPDASSTRLSLDRLPPAYDATVRGPPSASPRTEPQPPARSCWDPFAAFFGAARRTMPAPSAPLPAEKKSAYGAHRDFTKAPAILSRHTKTPALWLKGDTHGDLERDLALWRANGLAEADARDIQHWGMDKSVDEAHRLFCSGCARCAAPWNKPAPLRWTGKDAVICVTGDLINKGFFNLATLDFYMELQSLARAEGGDVVVTMGNHEVSANLNIKDAKCAGPGGLLYELPAYSIPLTNEAFRKSRFGQFLFQLPIAADIDGIFAAHGGQTSSRTIHGLNNYIVTGMENDGFASPVLTGTNSILQRRNWYGKNGWQGPFLVKILKRKLLAFGHDPDSIAPTGKPIFFGPDVKGHPSLLRLDCGESRGIGNGGYSPGFLVRIGYDEHERMAWIHDHHGKITTKVKLAPKQIEPPEEEAGTADLDLWGAGGFWPPMLPL